jgi:hypothetical protein
MEEITQAESAAVAKNPSFDGYKAPGFIVTLRLRMEQDRNDYELRIRGTLSPGWADCLYRAECRAEGTDSVLTLRSADRSALYGALRVLGDLDCRLVSVRILGP